MTIDLENLVRTNIKNLVKYSTARDEYTGKIGVFLDANENAFGSPIEGEHNRYPDPHQYALKSAISKIKGVSEKYIFLGNGSDEAIDVLIRIFCQPGSENIIICPPTYGMYEVAAAINDVAISRVPLLPETFGLDVEGILKAINPSVKIIFLCSPNNPTGNTIAVNDIKNILDCYNGIVVVDEAYINYSSTPSLIYLLTDCPNLIILQTMSKAWGLASLRIGLAFASAAIIDLMNKVKAPYNISGIAQKLALEAMTKLPLINDQIKITVAERKLLISELTNTAGVKKIFPSEANFILVKVEEPNKLFEYLLSVKIIVRNRSRIALCDDCLRITIGTPEENRLVLESLKFFYSREFHTIQQ